MTEKTWLTQSQYDLLSSELEELLEVCHRILIMENGRLIDEVPEPEKLSIDDLYAMCMGESVNETV